MFLLEIPKEEAWAWDTKSEDFVSLGAQRIQMEHSLLSLSKWESEFCKPFLGSPITEEEELAYIKCMTITPNVNPLVYNIISPQQRMDIREYTNASKTATWFSEDKKSKSAKANSEKITSELIYYWMIAYNIPFECQKWHLNRLMTLIRICDIKNRPPEKMSRKEIYAQNRALNQMRKAKLHTHG